MNIKVYNELIEAQKLIPVSRSWKEYSYEEYINNDFELLKSFIRESTLETYTTIWRKTAREYVAYRNHENFKYAYPVLDGVPINIFYNYIGLVSPLIKALETYKEQVKPNLRAHYMTNSYTTSIYNADLLLQMLTLDGFTYKIEYREHNNNFIRFKIGKDKIEEHILEAKKLGKWINRNGENKEKREVLFRNLQNN